MSHWTSPLAPFHSLTAAWNTTAARAAIRALSFLRCGRRRSLTTARAVTIVLVKELRLEFRTREILTATVIFALVVVVLFSFAFDPTAAESRRYGPGLLWIA